MCVLQDDEAAVVEADGCPVNLRDTRGVEVSDQGCRVGKNVLVRLVGQHREVSERDVPVLRPPAVFGGPLPAGVCRVERGAASDVDGPKRTPVHLVGDAEPEALGVGRDVGRNASPSPFQHF